MNRIEKAVIPVAGLGTRLIPITKEYPKEMLPIFIRTENNGILVKPVLQVIFESLFLYGIRNFCFIVGRNKRVIEDYLTPDYNFLTLLKKKNKNKSQHLIQALESFYNIIDKSTIVFINQPAPKGFGDAIRLSRPFIDEKPFLVHAGDDIIFSKRNYHLKKLENVFWEKNADAVFLLEYVDDPKRYGVVIAEKQSQYVFKVNDIIEKPKENISNLAVVAVYIFTPYIFDAISKVKIDESGELQLTNAIKLLIEDGATVYGVLLDKSEYRIDIGTADLYYKNIKNIYSLR